MLTESELPFVRSVLANPPKQRVEEVASESHETRRIPDTYIYLVNDGKFITPTGELVESYIDRSTYLGQVEFNSFDLIQHWAQTNEGYAIWFSPPYPNIYPVSKIIIQESLGLEDNTKCIVNRAVVLDDNSEKILRLANLFPETYFDNPENLRATPIFPSKKEFAEWFGELPKYTTQTKYISSGEDITIKTDTYARLSDIHFSVPVVGENRMYTEIYQRARSYGLIGTNPGSCPSALKTAFSAVYEDSIVLNTGESKYVKNCGNCGTTIEAVISKGYRCKVCSGEYKGC